MISLKDSMALGCLLSFTAGYGYTGEDLINAAKKDEIETVKQMLGPDIDINYKDNIGRTALMTAAAYNSIDVAKLLIEKGADINLRNINGITALMNGVTHDNKDIVKMLIEYGADIDLKDNEGKTALMHAKGHLQIKKLIEAAEEQKNAIDHFAAALKAIA